MGDRQTVERPHRIGRIGGGCVGQDICSVAHRDDRVDPWVHVVDPVEMGTDDLDRTQLAGPDGGGEIDGGSVHDLFGHGSEYVRSEVLASGRDRARIGTLRA